MSEVAIAGIWTAARITDALVASDSAEESSSSTSGSIRTEV